LELKNKKLWEQQELTAKERKELDEVRIKAREICGKSYLSPRLDIFTQAFQSLQRYKELASELQVSYGNYQNGVRFVK
ncbi:hypothetical protein RFZ33_18480, partial [Acinetobacter baumannii]|nr:hypothetical protein [Acinetobacter baumannii]